MFKFFIAFLLLIFFFISKVNGENCGGILEGDAGEFSVESVEPGSTCVWIIKLLVNPTLLFQLNDISGGTVLNLYPEHDPSPTFLEPIALSSSNLSSTIETKSQTLVLILVQDAASYDRISFSWHSSSVDVEPLYLSSSANYVENTEGNAAWIEFNQRHSLLWALNLPSNKKVSLKASIQFETCDLVNPCQCSYFGAYEVFSNGFLREIYRVCGRSQSFEEIDLPSKILTFVYINSNNFVEQSMSIDASEPLKSKNSNSNRIDIEWSSRDAMENTTQQPVTTQEPTTTEAPEKPSVCPSDSVVRPCSCQANEDFGLRFLCLYGPDNQSEIHRAWAAIRQANNLTLPEQWLTIDSFTLSFVSEISKLDISPFFYTRMTKFEIHHNDKLTSFYNGQNVGDIRSNAAFPISEITNHGLIDAHVVVIDENYMLSNEGMENFFPYFTSNMTSVMFGFSNVFGDSYPIGDGSGEFEWLPGFSRLVNLESFAYYDHGIHPVLISNAPFKRNRNLRTIYEGYGNPVELGPNAFALDPPDVDFGEGEFLTIDLSRSGLNNSNFDSIGDPVLGGTNRPTKLVVNNNGFEFLSQSNFQHFLDENELNILNATYNNNFFCDQRMKWLKDGRDRYEYRVLGVLCTNDPGEDVFTTSLIS